MKTPLTILTEMRELLTDPGHWIKGTLARDASGRLAYSRCRTACQWCLDGALIRAAAGTMRDVVARIVRLLANAVTAHTGGRHSHHIAFNDDPTTTHADVLRVLDLARSYAAEEVYA